MGRSVIVDRTNRTRALRQRWLAIGQEAGCPSIAVVMSCDWDVCRKRNRERSDPRRVSEERMERMISAFEEPTVSEGFAAVIDRCACQTVSDASRLANASGR
jgi:tRNA uridine 5-carbamoylmethylation protein Kti12